MLISIWRSIYLYLFCLFVSISHWFQVGIQLWVWLLKKKKKSLLKWLRLDKHLPVLSTGFCTRTLGTLVLWILIWLTNISMRPLRAPDNSITSSATPYVALASLRAIISLIMLSVCAVADFIPFLGSSNLLEIGLNCISREPGRRAHLIGFLLDYPQAMMSLLL